MALFAIRAGASIVPALPVGRGCRGLRRRSSWTPGGSFDDATGVSVFGNTAIAFGPQGISALSLGDCEGEGFTGPLEDPFGIPGRGYGYAIGDVAWSWEQRDRDTNVADREPSAEPRRLPPFLRLAAGERGLRAEMPAEELDRLPPGVLGLRLPVALRHVEVLEAVTGAVVAVEFVGHASRPQRRLVVVDLPG